MDSLDVEVDKSYQCDLYNEDFCHNNDITTHKKINIEKGIYKCELCSRDFTISARRNETSYQCASCNEGANNGNKENIDTTARAVKAHQCSMCSKVFPLKSKLTVHA